MVQPAEPHPGRHLALQGGQQGPEGVNGRSGASGLYDNTAYVEQGLFQQRLRSMDVDPSNHPAEIGFTESGNVGLTGGVACGFDFDEYG